MLDGFLDKRFTTGYAPLIVSHVISIICNHHCAKTKPSNGWSISYNSRCSGSSPKIDLLDLVRSITGMVHEGGWTFIPTKALQP